MNTEDTDLIYAKVKLLFTFDLRTSTVQAWFEKVKVKDAKSCQR